MNDYVAIVKRNGDDELQHYKYIKRVKKNGKWVYYYDTSELDKFDRGYTENYQIRKDNGRQVEDREVIYEKTDKWSAGDITYGSSIGSHDYKTIVKKQSKADRIQAKVEKMIYDKVLSKAGQDKKQKAINKGKQKLNNLLSKKKSR